MTVSPSRRFTPIPLLSPLDCRPPRFVRRRRSTVNRWGSFFCTTTMCATLPLLSRRCWSFSRVPTKREPHWVCGTARHSKGPLLNTKPMKRTNVDRDTGRLEAFSDGVIAVAITLLILDVHVPNVQTGLLQALLNQWPTYLGYVTSFLVITIFWANHHNMFRYIQQVDYALLLINAFFLMCIAFIPFATAVLTKYITSPTEQHTAAIVYGATLLLNGILFNSIWWYAVWKRRLVGRDIDAQVVRRITKGYLFGLPFWT